MKFGAGLVVATLAIVAIYIAFTRWVTDWRSQIQRQMNDVDNKAIGRAVDSLLNYETVKYFGAEDREAKRYEDAVGAYARAAVRNESSLAWLNIGQAFITNLNSLAKTNPQLATTTVPEVLGNLNALDDSIKTAVRNNLGGHANHSMFWEIMGPNGGKPEGEVLAAIERDLGGMEKLQTEFNAAGGRQFGSGWVFVTIAKEGKLAIETRPNQDSPIMDGKRVLLGNDVWEHAYYLNYQNRRADSLKAW